MFNHMTSMDVPVLLSLGFTFGMNQSILWGTDNNGVSYQVLDDGRWLLFGKQRDSGGIDSHERMRTTTFSMLFRTNDEHLC